MNTRLANVAIVCLLPILGYAQNQPQSLAGFFGSLRTLEVTERTWQDYDKFELRVPSMPAPEISKALPAILAVLDSDRINAQKIAMAALIAIGLRTDSAELLRPYVPSIAQALNSSDSALQSGAVLVIGTQKPAPPNVSLAVLRDFVHAHGRDPNAQVSALSILLLFKPDDPDVVQATVEYLSKNLDHEVYAAALYAVRGSRARDPKIQVCVVSALENAKSDVALAAIGAMERMGDAAIRNAEPALRRLESDTSKSLRVRQAAANLLRRTNPSQ